MVAYREGDTEIIIIIIIIIIQCVKREMSQYSGIKQYTQTEKLR